MGERQGLERLKGASEVRERKEKFTTDSGIEVKRVYTPEDVTGLDYERNLGLPGEEPYTRGIYPTMYRGRLWTIRQFSGLNSAEATNERYKLLYQTGATGFAVALDYISTMGMDPDMVSPREAGTGGVNISSLEDMEELFDGIPIDKISVAVIPGMWNTCSVSAMYFALAEKRGIDLNKLEGTTEGDPISAASCAPNVFPYHDSMRLVGDLVEWCAVNAPKWHPVSFTSYNYREGGINAYQEIAVLMAAVIGTIDEVIGRGRGLTADDFVPRFASQLSADSDFFEEIAKLRAVRRMWYKVMTERYKVKDPRSMAMRFHVQTAGSSLTYQQPLNNAIRAAYQALAAVLGGTQSLHVDSYDEALCIPTEESVKLSIRTQQILQEETNVTNTIDPLGGSYYIEWLTNEVEKKAWEYLEKIEKQGDWVKAVESGWLRCDQEKEIVKHQREVENGQRKVVGVNCFQEAEEVPKISFLRRDPQVYERQKAKLERLRGERDNRKVEEALEELREVTERKENVMPAVMKAVKAYATQGEISNVWSRVFNGIPRGEYLTSSSHLEATGTITL